MITVTGSVVVAVAPATDAATALRLMRANHLRHLSVVDGHRCVGLLTETDVPALGGNRPREACALEAASVVRDARLVGIATAVDVLAQLARPAKKETENQP